MQLAGAWQQTMKERPLRVADIGNFTFQKPPGSETAKRFSCNDQKIASVCSQKNCLWNSSGRSKWQLAVPEIGNQLRLNQRMVDGGFDRFNGWLVWYNPRLPLTASPEMESRKWRSSSSPTI